jgi:hypothetical protein
VCVFQVWALGKEAEFCHVDVAVDEAWDDGFVLGIYDFGAFGYVFSDLGVGAYGGYSAFVGDYCLGFWLFGVECDYVGVEYDKRIDHNHRLLVDEKLRFEADLREVANLHSTIRQMVLLKLQEVCANTQLRSFVLPGRIRSTRVSG